MNSSPVEHTSIRISEDSLFGDTIPHDEGYDARVSGSAFVESLENHLTIEYPDAELDITYQASSLEDVRVNGQLDHPEIFEIDQLVDKVFNGDEWLTKIE